MITVVGGGYTYPSGVTIGPVDLRVAAGERVVLAGPSGSGKTTILRQIAGLHQRAGWGTAAGRVTVDDLDPATIPPSHRPSRIGWVAQDPGDQLVCGTVADEIAFGPECAGWEPARIVARIPVILERIGLAGFEGRDPRTLSTGEQQRLVVGAALAGGARVLLLDEPLAHLDPDGAAVLLARLADVARTGVAVVLAEHRLHAVGGWCDRLIHIDQGRIVTPDEGPGDRPGSDGSRPGSRETESPPGRDSSFSGQGKQGPANPVGPEIVTRHRVRRIGEPVATVRGLTHRYGDQPVLDGVDLVLHAGERVALLGANGSGKSTLLGLLSGRLGSSPIAGTIEVPQDPDLTLFCPSVRAELAYGPTDRRVPDVAERVGSVARGLGLEALLDRSPHALSRGQRQRVAVGAALTCTPRILLLDEPTAGQDLAAVESMLEALDETLGDGALLFATHDLGLAARHATRTIRLSGGRLDAGREPLVRTESAGRPAEAGLDPRARLLLLFAVGGYAVILEHPGSLAVLAGATLLALLVAPISAAWRWRALGFAATIVLSTAWTQGLFYAGVPRTALVRVGPIAVWQEGVLHGLVQSLRLVAMGVAGTTLALSTSPERLLAGLTGLRVPHGVAFLAVAALRFVPVVGAEWLAVRQARARRGRPLWPRSPWAWLAEEMGMLAPVAARAVRRARTLAESLEARGFDPVDPRRSRVPFRLRPRDGVLLGVVYTGLATICGAAVLYRLYLWGIWYSPALRPLYGWVRAWS